MAHARAAVGLKLAGALGLGIGLLGFAAGAAAQGDANAAKGLIADRCAKCHETPYTKPGERSTAVAAPAFRTLANDPDRYPAERLRASLRQPHFPMQQLTLSPTDIENILAYLATLRRH